MSRVPSQEQCFRCREWNKADFILCPCCDVKICEICIPNMKEQYDEEESKIETDEIEIVNIRESVVLE